MSYVSHQAPHGLGLGFWLFVCVVVAFAVHLRGQEASSRIFRMRALSGRARPNDGTAADGIGMTTSANDPSGVIPHTMANDETAKRPLAA